MGTNTIFPTSIGPVQKIQFRDPAGVLANYSTKLNPAKMVRSPSNVRKWQGTVNGASLIIGQTELPPKEIALAWDHVDITDLQGIAAFTAISPSIFIDNRDNGYLGALVLDSPEQLVNTPNDAWAVKGSFLVVSPYDGQTKVLNKLAVPTLTVNISTTGGYIPASTSVYLWATVSTPSGESLVGSTNIITTGSTTSTNMASISWTAPASNYYKKLTLYWSSTNNSATATFLADIWAGQTQTFTVFGPYFGYAQKTPPTYTRAYTGNWQGGLWVPGT